MPEANYPLRNWVSGYPPVTAFDMQQINAAVDGLDYRVAKLEDVKGEGDWTLTSTQTVPAGVPTRVLFGLQNRTPVGLLHDVVSVTESGNTHNASRFTVQSGYAGKWRLILDARWTNAGLVNTDRYAMIGPAAGGDNWWGRNSSGGLAFNVQVTAEEWLNVGDQFNAWVYNGAATSIIRESATSLVTRFRATQIRAA